MMHHGILDTTSTIVAPATASGGATVVVRISGIQAIDIADSIFSGQRRLSAADGYTLHYGKIIDGNRVIDDVVVALFRAPHSYTGEDTVEITAHGSKYITSEIIRLAIEHGARMASAGEFTRRAYLAGKMDLSRAEAVADMIASDTEWSHTIAITQMRGVYSERLAQLCSELLHICSLIELELDFSEEDVEFADRSSLRQILKNVGDHIDSLISSFALGNVLKDGVNVAIIGSPNVGKSTLLNALIGDDRAMVSDIAGTTRDTIEATTVIDGVRFRFIDTAGLRETEDTLEMMGIERSRKAISNAHIILHVASADDITFEDIPTNSNCHYIQVINKIDMFNSTNATDADYPAVMISAKHGTGVDTLRSKLRSTVDTDSVRTDSVIVSNMRHYEALRQSKSALIDAHNTLDAALSSDLLSEDIRRILHHLGEITGEITSDDILHNIFSKFCIGK